MPELLPDLVFMAARGTPSAPAVIHGRENYTYDHLADTIHRAAEGFLGLGLKRGDRVGVYLEKRPESVIAMFAAAAAGGIFVPINPLLKPRQSGYILGDCGVRFLVTSGDRLSGLTDALDQADFLSHVIITGSALPEVPDAARLVDWESFLAIDAKRPRHAVGGGEAAAILYTSGSTGMPKGVVLSHGNLLSGAESVASYLGNTSCDKILAVLPLSFDYGLSQLTSGFSVGASVVLLNYLLPQDVMNALARYQITGLAGIPTLWIRLAELQWPQEALDGLRYITNSGGAIPLPTLDALRNVLRNTKIFLMYGFTEAFRSTYLPPDELDRRPTSIGKAVPNAEVFLIKRDGTPSDIGETGELVHRGPFVTLGYWNDQQRTSERFRPLPSQHKELPSGEAVAWSGDEVRMDEDGFLYKSPGQKIVRIVQNCLTH